MVSLKNKKYELTFEREGVKLTLMAQDINIYREEKLISFSTNIPNSSRPVRLMFPLERLIACREVTE